MRVAISLIAQGVPKTAIVIKSAIIDLAFFKLEPLKTLDSLLQLILPG